MLRFSPAVLRRRVTRFFGVAVTDEWGKGWSDTKMKSQVKDATNRYKFRNQRILRIRPRTRTSRCEIIARSSARSFDAVVEWRRVQSERGDRVAVASLSRRLGGRCGVGSDVEVTRAQLVAKIFVGGEDAMRACFLVGLLRGERTRRRLRGHRISGRVAPRMAFVAVIRRLPGCSG